MFVLWACWEEASAPNWTIWLSANIQKILCRSDTDTASSLDNISGHEIIFQISERTVFNSNAHFQFREFCLSFTQHEKGEDA